MSSSVATVPAGTRLEPIAPWWHTVLVMAPIGIGSIASAWQHGLPDAHVPGLGFRLSSYVTVLAIEWIPVLFIWLALKRRGLALGTLIGGRWSTVRSFFRDLRLALAFLFVAVSLVGGMAYLLGAHALDKTMANITPTTVLECVASLGLSAIAGFCEELVFRGYLTRQFSAWTGSPAFGILLQGAAFGLAHGYYHRVMLAIMVQGWLFGLFAHWRRSLLPGMLAHGMQDGLGNAVAFFSRM